MPLAAVIFTDCTELDYSGFPPEVLKLSGAPTTPSQLVQSINPATAQAILARAARAANRGVAQSTALFANTTTTTRHPTPVTVSIPAPSGAAAYSDSEDEEANMATPTTDPLAIAYSSAFK